MGFPLFVICHCVLLLFIGCNTAPAFISLLPPFYALFLDSTVISGLSANYHQ